MSVRERKEETKPMEESMEASRGTVSKILKVLHKVHGEDAAMTLGQTGPHSVKVISTGSRALDEALGVGGLPAGRVVEVYGPESSGKTTLALSAIASAQKGGGVAAFVDAEHALDPSYAQNLGVRLDSLIFSQPDSGEQALEIVDSLVRCGSVDVVVVDSVAALVPRAEIDGQMGDAHVGLHARLMSQALRKLTSAAHRSGTTVIFINQIRHKIGVMFGSPETTTGGNALKFYSSVRLDVRRKATLKSGEEAYGNLTKVKVVKNKMAPPFRVAEFEIVYGEGIHREAEVLAAALALGVISKTGAWLAFQEVKLGQGRKNACAYLKEHSSLREKVEQRLLEGGDGGANAKSGKRSLAA
jgi:recombination protein RecA